MLPPNAVTPLQQTVSSQMAFSSLSHLMLQEFYSETMTQQHNTHTRKRVKRIDQRPSAASAQEEHGDRELAHAAAGQTLSIPREPGER